MNYYNFTRPQNDDEARKSEQNYTNQEPLMLDSRKYNKNKL